MSETIVPPGAGPEPVELRHLPAAALLLAPDGRVRGCNPAFTALTGHTSGQLAGRTLAVLFGADTDQGTATVALRAVERGEVFTGELLCVRSNGVQFWCDLTLWPTRDGDAVCTHLVVLLRDVTARRIAHSALVAGSDRHGLVLDRIPAGIVIHKWSTEILYANAKATELLGITFDRILGVVSADPRWRFMTEDGQPLALEDFPVSRVIRTRSAFRDMVIGVRRPDEQHDVWLMGDGYPVMDDKGEPIEVIISFTEVTRIKAAERALVKSEERLTLVLQGSTDAPWDLDLVANTLYYSPRWWEMIGYAVDELTPDAELWIRLLHPDDEIRLRPWFMKLLASAATSYEVEFRLRHKRGHYVLVLSRGFVLRDERGVALRVSGTNTDVSERRAMEARLRQSQKLEAIGQLAGGVAHDFNNLLAVISGNLELLADEIVENGLATELLQEAMGAAQRGAELTRRLLASTRQQPLMPTVISVEPIIANLVQVLRRLINESITIETRIDANVGHICIDAGQFENALLNLAINARDAMPSGGVLTITAENIEIGEDSVPTEIDLFPGSYVRLAVTDDGVGMSREIARQSLEPFFTTKPVGSGSGLGLSMVYGFVKQSGGNLKIYSEPGVGTSVQLYLPATDAHTSETQAPPADIPRASAGRPEVILIVEDDTNVRLFCVRCLTSLGYTTIEAANGPAALEALAAAPQVDLLLTDVVMPNGMHGPAVAAEAQRRVSGLRVLFMSGYPAHMLDVGDELSVAHLLTKPFSKPMLAHTIRSLLDGVPVASVAHVRH